MSLDSRGVGPIYNLDLTYRVFSSDSFLFRFCSRYSQVTSIEKLQLKNSIFWKLNIKSHPFIQSFPWYRCKSDTTIQFIIDLSSIYYQFIINLLSFLSNLFFILHTNLLILFAFSFTSFKSYNSFRLFLLLLSFTSFLYATPTRCRHHPVSPWIISANGLCSAGS